MADQYEPPWLAAHKEARELFQAAEAKRAADVLAAAQERRDREAAAAAEPAKATGRGPGGKWLPGVRPEGSGKLPGTPDKRYALRQRLNGAAEEITEVVITAALKGNLDAASMVLARAVAPLRPQGRQVEFRFDLSASLTEQAQSVVNACADGSLTVEEAQMLVQCLSSAAGLRAVDQLEERIRQLEGKAAKPKGAMAASGLVVADVDEQGNVIQ